MTYSSNPVRTYRCPDCSGEIPYAHAYRAAENLYWCPAGHHYLTADHLLETQAEAVQ